MRKELKVKLSIALTLVILIAVGCNQEEVASPTTPLHAHRRMDAGVEANGGNGASTASAETDNPRNPSTTEASMTETVGSTQSVVGSWEKDEEDMTDQVIQFGRDGSMSIQSAYNDPKDVTLNGEGSWKQNGDHLYTQWSSFSAQAPAGADKATISQAEELNRSSAGRKLPSDCTITWKGPDHFALTARNGSVSNFTRKS